jgi:hypothetical protein
MTSIVAVVVDATGLSACGSGFDAPSETDSPASIRQEQQQEAEMMATREAGAGVE